ncbi:protein kinase [Planctomycetota bacterium]
MAGLIDDNQEHIFEAAMQEFAEAQSRGQEPDIDEFVKQYPGHENQLRQRIRNLEKISGLFDCLVRADENDFEDTAIGHDLVGQKVGSFEIVQMIGRGGMGVVYLARDTKLDRSVAIKSLPLELLGDSTARMRFQREAKLLASLNHPNIAVIHEIIEEERVGYLVLEYVPGETLAQRIAHKPLKLHEALSIGRQVAEAISAAHEKGVTHRDLKPGNIKMTPEGKVKVLDFGLAKVISSESPGKESITTEPGRIIGTPAYMSPEQARGKPTDKRSDIWSFGCLLYEMLTGKALFKGETVSDTLVRLLEREPDWHALPQTTPANIQVLLRRCLEKEPHRRLRDMGDIAITLEDTATELQHVTLRTETAETDRIQPMAGSRRVLPRFITGAAVTLVLFLVLIIVFKLGGLLERQRGKSVAELVLTESFDNPTLPDWERSPGVAVVDGVLRIEPFHFAFHPGEWGDLTLSVIARRTGDGAAVLLVKYGASDAGGYVVHLGPDFVVLQRAGVELAASPRAFIPPNEWLQVRVTVVGGTHEVVLNGQPALTATDSDPLPPGGVELSVQGDAPGEFNDLVVIFFREDMPLSIP